MQRGTVVVRFTAVCCLLAASTLASCRDVDAPTILLQPREVARDTPQVAPASLTGSIRCTVTVRTGELSCPDAAVSGTTLALQAAMTSGDRVIGGQGIYVRLASANVNYLGTNFTFDVTVHNLTTLAMGTADGATPHAAGVMVFIADDPVVTGGSGNITINADGTDNFTRADQPFYQYSTAGGDHLGADDILSPDETSTAKTWNFTIDNTVESFTFDAFVATHMSTDALATIAPQVESFSVTPLVPGSTVTLTGINFDAVPGSNTVTIGGAAATVTGGSATTLDVTVPCVSSGNVAVQVSTGGRAGAVVSTTLQIAQTSLDAGEPIIITSAGALDCTELASAGGEAEYLVAVYSANTSHTSNANFELFADVAGAPLAAQVAASAGSIVEPIAPLPAGLRAEVARAQERDIRHDEILEQNRVMYEQLMSRYPGDPAPSDLFALMVEPPLTRTFRIANFAPPVGHNICSSYYIVEATRVYFDGKLAIYEDDATPAAFQAALSPAMAAYYDQIGDQFNADMYPVITNYFGDPVRRDAVTDNNGVLVALFTPHINNSVPGVAGFVASCDQFPNNDTDVNAVGGPYAATGGSGINAASNFGEFFYAYQPTVDGIGYAADTPDQWYRTIRSTFIHETKHVASHAARVANGAPVFELSWLEEGTARHSEELWMRNTIDNRAWKSNTGYGSFANPISIYCDVRPDTDAFPECFNLRRPAVTIFRHFHSLYTHLFAQNASLLSPFGRAGADNGSFFYAISWSLVRYAIDRYATTEQAFLSALNESSTNGATNLTAAAGIGIDQLLGEWNLALAADDHPDIVAPDPGTQFATWDFRDIYAGFANDFPGSYTSYPQQPEAHTFGSFAGATINTLRGGGAVWYTISGTQSAPQLVRLRGAGAAALPADVRMAIVRVK